MPELLAALDAFVQEHRRCGDLDGGLEGERVWMTCECGASVVRPARLEGQRGTGRARAERPTGLSSHSSRPGG
jgi:hypothetical protein